MDPLKQRFTTIVLLLLLVMPLSCLAQSGNELNSSADAVAASQQQVCSQGEIPPELAQRIRDAAAQVETLSSQFRQEKYLSMFAETLQSSGQFYYQRPDQLRWELLQPVVSGFVLKGQKGRRWHARVKGSESFKLDQDPAMSLIAEQLFAWARADLDWLQQHYRIDMVSEQPIRLRLTPPQGQTGGFLNHLMIQFAQSASYVAEVEIHEQDGDYTRIIFNDTQMNTPIESELFAGRGQE